MIVETTGAEGALIEQALGEWFTDERPPSIGDVRTVVVQFAVSAVGTVGQPVDHPRGPTARTFTPAGAKVEVTATLAWLGLPPESTVGA